MKRRGASQAGFSLLELVIVFAIVAVAAAIAIPSIRSALRVSAYKSTMTSTVDRLVTLRARAAKGDEIQFSTSQLVLEDASMLINPRGVPSPDGEPTPESITFQGGTGHSYVQGVRRSAAIVIANSDDLTEAYAIVVSSTSRISTKRRTATGWEDFTQ